MKNAGGSLHSPCMHCDNQYTADTAQLVYTLFHPIPPSTLPSDSLQKLLQGRPRIDFGESLTRFVFFEDVFAFFRRTPKNPPRKWSIGVERFPIKTPSEMFYKYIKSFLFYSTVVFK